MNICIKLLNKAAVFLAVAIISVIIIQPTIAQDTAVWEPKDTQFWALMKNGLDDDCKIYGSRTPASVQFIIEYISPKEKEGYDTEAYLCGKECTVREYEKIAQFCRSYGRIPNPDFLQIGWE